MVCRYQQMDNALKIHCWDEWEGRWAGGITGWAWWGRHRSITCLPGPCRRLTENKTKMAQDVPSLTMSVEFSAALLENDSPGCRGRKDVSAVAIRCVVVDVFDAEVRGSRSGGTFDGGEGGRFCDREYDRVSARSGGWQRILEKSKEVIRRSRRCPGLCVGLSGRRAALSESPGGRQHGVGP